MNNIKKLILGLILCLGCIYPINVYALDPSSYEISIDQDDETYDIIIECSNIDYLNAIEAIELYDGETTTNINIQKNFNLDYYNAILDENNNSLTIFYSTLLNLNQGNYKVTINALGYDDVEVDYGLLFEKNTINTPVDLQVNLIENGIEFKSKNYSFIHGLVLSYNENLNDYTYSYLQFSNSSSFENSILFENISQDFPYSLIEMNSDGSYSVMIIKDMLKKMGIESNLEYYILIKSASFKDVVFGPFILIEEEIQQDENIEDELEDIVDDELDISNDEESDETLNEDIDENVDDKEEEYDNSMDGYLLGLIFVSFCLIGYIGYLFYLKFKNHKGV